MKIKSIENFSLEECQKYLEANTNGESAQEVVQRMEYLLHLKNRKSQQDNARRINEFNTEFNRYYATQRYEEAFAICLQYMNDAGDKATIIEKADLVIPKLKNRILLPSSISVSYDWLIDQLVLKGYNNMKYDGTTIKWKSSTVKLSINDSTTRITSECRINLFFRFVIFIVLCLLLVFIISFLHMDRFYGIVNSLIIIFFMIWGIYGTILNQHKKLLRSIAQITIDYISK